MKMILPEDYINELRLVLGSDTEKYLQSFEKEPFRGISVNLLKTTPEKLLPLLGFETEKYIPKKVKMRRSHTLMLYLGKMLILPRSLGPTIIGRLS